MWRWLTPFLFLSLPAPLKADVLHVPGDHPSIGAAVTSADDGDLILVADGTYTGPENRDVNFGGKNLAVRSENGPEACIIDCQGLGRAFEFDSKETSSALVQGFTITNGNAATGNGGAIDCTLESSPTIRDCSFLNNHAYALGGAIACRGVSPALIEDCFFSGNDASGYQDGAYGGAISFFVLSDSIVRDCVFVANSADFGGAIDCSISFPQISNCLMIGNSAALGGAVSCSACDPTFTQCTFSQNVSATGGAVALIGQVLPSYPVFDSCILWGDAPNEFAVFIGQPTVSWSDVLGGWSGVGNLALDPLFESPVGGDFHLKSSSPCIDSGNPAIGSDPDCTLPDMGAFPHLLSSPPTIYCTAKPTSSGCIPALEFTGTPSASGSGSFLVQARQVEADRIGLFFWSTNGPATIPLQGGLLCVQPPIVRAPVSNTGSAGHPPCGGVLSLDLNAVGIPSAIGAGGQAWLQGWFRDPQSQGGLGLTDAIHFSVCR